MKRSLALFAVFLLLYGQVAWASGISGGATVTADSVVSAFDGGSCSGYLKDDGTCDTPAGTGTVTGPATATEDNVVCWGADNVTVKDCAHAVTTFGWTVLDDANAAAARTTLGIVIGTDVLAPNGDGSSLTGLTKAQVSLGAVENTALSTWAGSTNITTLGTISTGTVPWANVGAGGQAADADLSTLAAPTAWRVFYSDGSSAITELALGASGTYLKSTGATSAPAFDTPAGSGDMLQSIYDSNTDNVVDTAAALAANPADCGGGQFATGIAANGDLTCDTPAGAGDMLQSIYDANTDNVVDTSAALAANGGNCSAGQSPLGVDIAGAVESCWTPVSGPASAIDNQIVLFDSTTGKIIKASNCTISDNVISCPASATTPGYVRLPEKTGNGSEYMTLIAPDVNFADNNTTLTLPNATDTLVGKATTDTLTNKTFSYDGSGNSLTLPFDRSYPLLNPLDNSDIIIDYARVAVTIDNVDCIANGTTPSVSVDVHECDQDGASNCATILSAPITCNGGFDSGTITDSAIAVDHTLKLVINGAPTGTVTGVTLFIKGSQTW